MPKLVKSANVSRNYSGNKSGTFLWRTVFFYNVSLIIMLLVMYMCSQKLSGGREEVVEEQQAQVLEDVHSIAVTSRLSQPFKYTIS